MTEAEERDAFYQAIMDNWEDDTPRLVYADWLDERGDEPSRIRAELIRVQCEIARTGTTSRDKQSERELLDYVRKYTESQGIPLDAALGPAEFTRGFISDWLQNNPETFSRGTPDAWAELGPIDESGIYFLRSPNRRRASPVYKQLAEAPGLRYWRSVDSASNAGESVIGEANFRTLFGSPNLVNLRQIQIVDQVRTTNEEDEPIGERGVKAFADNPVLAQVSTLKFWWVGLTDNGLKTLAASKYLRAIRRLSLADRFTDAGVAALSKSPILKSVESLHLNGTITGRTLECLATSSQLQSLHTLDLSGHTSGGHEHDSLHYGSISEVLDRTGFRALLDSPLLSQLKVLKLHPGNGDADVTQLVEAADRMTALQRLDLDHSPDGYTLNVLRRWFSGKLYFWGRPDEGK